jgi:outer membrane protein assembly factor BamB
VKNLAAVLSAVLLSPVFMATAEGEDWPYFLGLRGTGESAETSLALDWTSAAPGIVWKQPVGTGYSAPSILGQRLVLHHRVDDQEIISCRRVADGTEIWKQGYASSFSDPYGYNNGPRCSPVLTSELCYTLGADGMLTCVSMQDGTVVWQHDLKQKFQIPDWFFGMGCSPILDGERLIVLVGGQPDSGVVAFNAKDGRILWQAVGKQTWNGAATDDPEEKYEWEGTEMVASYSSPIIATIHGRRHLLCLMRQGLVSVDPETGQENFHYWFRARVHESVNAAVPVVVEDRIFLTAAYEVGSALLQVDPSGRSVRELWRIRDNMLAHWSTPIHDNGYVYGFSGRHENEGELRCVRLTDGAVVWKTDGLVGDPKDLARDRTTGQIINRKTGAPVPYPYFGRGSLIRSGNRFIVLGERGTLSVVSVSSKGFTEHGRTSFDEIHYPAWAAPVLSNGRLYLRSEDWLLCLNLRPKL